MTLTWKHLQQRTLLKLTNVKTEQHFFDGRNTKQKRTLLKLANTKETEKHFSDGAQNRTQLHFGEPSNKHKQIQKRSNKPQSSRRKRLTKIFNQQLTSMHY